MRILVNGRGGSTVFGCGIGRLGKSGIGAAPGPEGMIAEIKIRCPDEEVEVVEGDIEVDWMEGGPFCCSRRIEETWEKREEIAVLMLDGREDSGSVSTRKSMLVVFWESDGSSGCSKLESASTSMTRSSMTVSRTLDKLGS